MTSTETNTDTTQASAWQKYVVAPVDGAALAYFRIAFGLIMLWEVCRYARDRESGSWIERYYIEPEMFFTYFGFGWVQPWDGSLMHVHFAVLGLLAIFIALGLFYRVCTLLFALGFTQVFLIDMSNYLNHFYLISLVSFVMVVLPANRTLAVDALIWPKLRSKWVPAWSLWFLRLHIAIPYFFGGVAKINGDWLRGEPMRSWMHNRQDFPLIGGFFTDEWMVSIFVYGGLLLDLCVVPFLLWPKTRVPALVAACTFHVLNDHLFTIGIFPWFMIAASMLFLEPETIRKLFFQPASETEDEHEDEAAAKPPPSLPPDLASPPRWLVYLLVAHVSIQLVAPFRHWLYPGNVSWTEEGHNFSWHMKLRTKAATARFEIHDPATGKRWSVRPEDYLTTRQSRKMKKRPDMIIQYSHWLAERWAHDGHPDVEVRAIVRAGLNGRPRQLLIDPNVDLTKKHRSLWPANWILPLTEPLVLSEIYGDER